MIKYTALVLASIVTLYGCNKNDPTPHISQEQLSLETRTIKISAEDWEPYGTPGDDTHGYAATATSDLLSSAIVSDGLVQLHLRRSNGAWLEIPVTIAQGGPAGMNWGFKYYLNGLRISIDRNGEQVTPPDEAMVFRLSVGPKNSPGIGNAPEHTGAASVTQ